MWFELAGVFLSLISLILGSSSHNRQANYEAHTFKGVAALVASPIIHYHLPRYINSYY